jgi:hypothetical protein
MKRIQNVEINSLDINKSYVEIDGVGWRNSSHISIKEIMESMQLDIPLEANVKFVTFKNQDVSVNTTPDNFPIESNLQISMDENFLYVWVSGRWKRVPLSEF